MTAVLRRASGLAPAHVVVVGPLTAATSRDLHLRLRRVVRGGAREVRVDLSAVERVDTSAVAVLLVYARLLPPLGGRLVLTGTGDTVVSTLTSMGLARLLGQARPTTDGWTPSTAARPATPGLTGSGAAPRAGTRRPG